MKSILYRPEVDGLRAVAVLSVIAFHVGLSGIPGGFTGVDIFYVISGYLITTIISKSLAEKRFSFGEFYTRRIKRILPAAVSMVVCTVILAALFLTPDKYLDLSRSAISANVFVANFWFMSHSGYFDQATTIAPLAHTWSLSVEEQFYLIFPIVLYISYRLWHTRGVRALVCCISITSFFLSIYLSTRFPNFSFYMLPTRAWELGFGAGLALIPQLSKSRLHNILSTAGVGAIAYGLVAITENSPYPGYLAMFPTVGTSLIIYFSNCEGNLVKSILALPPLVFIGRISYSSYLWHWPIVVFYKTYVTERPFEPLESVCLIGASLTAGFISWKYVEERFRYKNYPQKKVFTFAVYASLFSIILPGVVTVSNGFPGRLSPESLTIVDRKLMWEWPCTEQRKFFPENDELFCVIGESWEKASSKGILWGDSHALHWAPVIHLQALRVGMTLVVVPWHCPPYLNSEFIKLDYPKFPNISETCTERNNLTVNLVKDTTEIDLIIMAAAWAGYTELLYSERESTNRPNGNIADNSGAFGGQLSEIALKKLLANLTDKNVLILGDFPRPNKNLNECEFAEKTLLLREKCEESYYKVLDAKEVSKTHKYSDTALENAANAFLNANVIFPGDVLCDTTHCKTYVNGELLYLDSNHIRRNLSDETLDALSYLLGLTEWFAQYENDEKRL